MKHIDTPVVPIAPQDELPRLLTTCLVLFWPAARKARAVSRRPCSRDLPLPPFSSGALLAVATISGPTTMANSCCNCHRFAARAVALRRSALDRRAPRLRCSTPRTRPAATLPLWLGTTGASQVPPRPSRSAQGGWPLSVYPDQPAKLPAWRSTGPGCPLLHRSSRCSVCLSSPAPLSSQPACVSRRELAPSHATNAHRYARAGR
jgi:hypothetical protein